MEWLKRPSGLVAPPEELSIEHHSLSDWDFHPNITYALDNAIYITSPSSLRLGPVSAGGGSVLCRDSATLNLPQGRVESYWRASYFAASGQGICFYFRQQSALGAFDNDNTYYVTFHNTTAAWEKRVSAVRTVLGSWTRAHSLDTFYLERVTFWKEAALFMCRYEYWSGSSWVTVTPDLTDSSPSFEGSGTNRIGLGCNQLGLTTQRIYFDSTKIYGPA